MILVIIFLKLNAGYGINNGACTIYDQCLCKKKAVAEKQAGGQEPLLPSSTIFDIVMAGISFVP